PGGLLFAILLALLGLFVWVLARSIPLTTLPKGELHDRLFELAEQVQARPRLVYLLPPGRWRLVNALGLPGNVVYFCADLLPHLSRREVDALLVHELTRVWRMGRHALGQALRLTGWLLLLGVAAGGVVLVAGPLDALGLLPLLPLLL